MMKTFTLPSPILSSTAVNVGKNDTNSIIENYNCCVATGETVTVHTTQNKNNYTNDSADAGSFSLINVTPCHAELVEALSKGYVPSFSATISFRCVAPFIVR